MTLQASDIASTVAPYDMVRKMRASILVLGPEGVIRTTGAERGNPNTLMKSAKPSSPNTMMRAAFTTLSVVFSRTVPTTRSTVSATGGTSGAMLTQPNDFQAQDEGFSPSVVAPVGPVRTPEPEAAAETESHIPSWQ